MDARTLLVRAGTVATMDDAATEFADGGVFVRGPVIEAVGPRATLPASADEVIDLPRHVLLPGLVNTHHHLFQTLTRALPAAQDASLFDWLRTLYPVWARLTPEMIHASALTGFAELLLSGCTTTSDHLYLYPNGSRLDDTLRAAAEIGIRFHACRGSTLQPRTRATATRNPRRRWHPAPGRRRRARRAAAGSARPRRNHAA